MATVCVALVTALWFGKLFSGAATGAFDLGKLLEDKAAPVLLGSKGVTADQANDFMLVAWPAIATAAGIVHPADASASATFNKVGNMAMGELGGAAILEGHSRR